MSVLWDVRLKRFHCITVKLRISAHGRLRDLRAELLASFASAHSSRFSLWLGVALTPNEFDIDWEEVYKYLDEIKRKNFLRNISKRSKS